MSNMQQSKLHSFFKPEASLQSNTKKHSDSSSNGNKKHYNGKHHKKPPLDPEKQALKASLKKVGEETRASYSNVESYSPRVKAAYTSTYSTTRSAPIPPSSPTASKTPISVLSADTLEAAASLLRSPSPSNTSSPSSTPTIGVLNMASERHIGGGFLTGAPAQEESLCRSTTLYPCLTSVKETCYPISPAATLVSPDVLVFRGGVAQNFAFLPQSECFFVTVLSVAAIRNPRLSEDGKLFERHADRVLTAAKIRQTLRAAWHAGVRSLVLGALGCGAFKNPPREVAKVFKEVLEEEEFRRAFERIVFAVIDSGSLTYGKGKTNNYGIFKETLEDDGGDGVADAVQRK